jgi:hypothetical protein
MQFIYMYILCVKYIGVDHELANGFALMHKLLKITRNLLPPAIILQLLKSFENDIMILN